MWELCKARTKKFCPNKFNLYVIVAGHDMTTDAARATNCRQKNKAPSLPTKCSKNAGSCQNMGFNRKTVSRFQTIKRNKNKNFEDSKASRGTHCP